MSFEKGNTPGFKIRRSRPTDVSAIKTFVKASWARTYDPVIGEEERKRISNAKHVETLFLEEIGSKESGSLVAFDGENEIIGHIGGAMRDNGIFFVDRLHIDPRAFGTGLAHEMMRQLAEHLHTLASAIELTVLLNNERALGFYKKFGFVEARGSNEDEGLGGVPSVLMRYELK